MAPDDLHALPSLADAELTGIEWSGCDLVVHITTWDARRFTVRFLEVAGMRESCARGEIADLKQRPATGAFATWCIDRTYDGSPQPRIHSYVVADIDDDICLEVVAEAMEVTEVV